MQPFELGKKYDNIALWWHQRHGDSSYGVKQLERAIELTKPGGKALDVGCGAGGRFIRILENKGYSITGLDVSEEMLRLARKNHPEHVFLHEDICSWEPEDSFDFIVAWDSLFHLPLDRQKEVLSRLCRNLEEKGVLIYTFGNAQGEHVDQWQNDTFYYSSIGINENLQLLIDNDLVIMHLELDQYPENHVYVIATRP